VDAVPGAHLGTPLTRRVVLQQGKDLLQGTGSAHRRSMAHAGGRGW